VIAALVAVQVLFGLHYPIIKPAFAVGLDPGAWAAVRATCAAALLLGTARWFGCPFPGKRRELWGLAGAAVLGVVINQISFVFGLSLTTPGYSALINVSIPVTALLFAWLLRFEQPNLARVAGITVAAGGLGLMLTGGLRDDWRTGNLLTLVNALSFGCFLVVSRPVYRRVHPYAGTAVLFAFGTIGILAVVGWRIPRVDWLALPWWAWAAMAYAILGATVGSYALNGFALRHADASVVGFFILLQPLIATAASALAGGERLDFRFGLAAVLVVLGVTLVLRGPPSRPD
jgi:drug/metabolite transporter (DMT)-like permease